MKSLCTKYGKRGLSMLLILAMVFSLGFLNTTAKAISIDDVKSSVETALLLSELFSGSGTDESPYLIADEQDLIELQLVSNGTGDSVLQSAYAHGAGMYFKLTADISLTADWTPIANGSDYYFAGSFDGDGHTISGLNMTAEAAAGETAYGGLFGYTDGATISNLNVTGSVSVSLTADDENTDSSAIYAGGIVGCAVDTTVSDCTVNVTVKAANAATGTVNVVAGGAVGYLGVSSAETSASITNVSAQSGTYVSATTSTHGDAILTLAGGVVGLAHGSDVSGCTSAASVVVNGSKTLYQTGTYTTYGQFYNSQADGTSTNEGTGYYNLNEYHYSNTAGGVVGAAVSVYTLVTSSSGAGAGATTGITYTLDKETTVTDCTSEAIVVNETGSNLSFAGGVVGTSQFATVSGCSLSSGGQVNGAYAGGVFGVIAGDNTVSNCTASGAVTGTASAGGIAGQLGGHVFSRSGNQGSDSATFAESTLANCTASGTVTCSDGYAGGIVGYMTYADSISGSSNAATVTGSNAGGILGGVYNSYSSSGVAPTTGGATYSISVSSNAVTDCYNSGTVSGSVSAGGIAGYAANPCTTISDCSNSGTVSGTGTYAGGVVAYYYGVPDYSDSLVRNVSNSANVTGSATYAGGVIGYLDGNITNVSYYSVALTNAYNNGTVVGGSYAGGVVGYAVYGMSNCYNSGAVTGSVAGGIAGVTRYSKTEITDSYALSGSESQLVCYDQGGSVIEDVSFFDGTQALTTDSAGYGTLLVALNAFVAENSTDDVSLNWWGISSTYPGFTDTVTKPTTTVSAPAIMANGASSSSETVNFNDELVLSIDAVTAEDGETVYYQWYSSTSSSESTRSKIDGANGLTYTVDTSTGGTVYYWVGISAQNSYMRTTEVFNATAFAATVELSIDEVTGAINAGTFTIDLADSSSNVNSESNPYVIDTAEKLLALPTFLNSNKTVYYFEQTADIDLDGTAWTPIGNSTTSPFNGSYDGGNHKISGLYITDTPAKSTTYYGLFGVVEGGTIKDLTISGEITLEPNGTNYYGYVGGLVGRLNAGSTIDNCTVEDMTVSGGSYTGGVVGRAYTTAVIENISSSAQVSSSSDSAIGGIAGQSNQTSEVFNVTNSGTVTGSADASVGGLFGVKNGAGKISGSSNTGTVTSSSGIAGGLVGTFSGAGTLADSSNEGTVVSSAGVAGGLVGTVSAVVTIINDSNSGAVTGSTYVGGLAGSVTGAFNLLNSYNSGDVAGLTSSSVVGGIAGDVNIASAVIENCYSSGAVSAYSSSTYGGVAGSNKGSVSSSYYLEQTDLNAIGSNSGTAAYLATFADTTGTLTAADEESGLAYTGDLLNQLNAWVIDNSSVYSDAYGWTGQDDDYPVLSSDVDLSGAAPAAVTVEMAAENPSKVNLNSSGVELTANITLADGAVGTVTYQWLADDEVVSSGTFETTAETTALTSSVAVETGTSGQFTYTLEVVNTNPDYAVYQSASAEATIVVDKPEGDTKWYGSWDVADNFAGGSGTEDDPYLISEANQLALLAQYVNDGNSDYVSAYYKLTADIDLNNEQWTRIGSTNSFTGYFDGDDHSITGLYFSGSSSAVGLFGYIGGATIENLNVTGDVEGTYAVAVLAGKTSGTNVIQNVLTYGSVVGTSGAAGDSKNGAAGLVGLNAGDLTMTNCGNEANVTVSGNNGAGGLMGLNYGSGGKTLTIDSCYNAGTITTGSSTDYGGGLIGRTNYGLLTIKNSYNIGTITGSGRYSAGLIGGLYNAARITSGSTIDNCYNAGTVAGTGSNYSLLGYNLTTDSRYSSYWTVTNCYYLSMVCAGVTDHGTYGTEVNALSASQLNGDSGSAFEDASAVGTVTFVTDHTSVTLADSSETITSASASAYPYLSWQSSSPDSYGYVAFQVSLTDSNYTLADVTASDGNVVTVDADDHVFVAAVTGDDTVTVNDVLPVSLTVTGENATLAFVSGFASETDTDSGVYTVGEETVLTFTLTAASGYAVTSVSATTSSTGEAQILTADEDGVYTLEIGTEDATLSFVTTPTYYIYCTYDNASKPEVLAGTMKSYQTSLTSAYCSYTVIDGDTVSFTVTPDSAYILTPDSVAFVTTAVDSETSEEYEVIVQTLSADADGVYTFTVSEELAGTTLAIQVETPTITVDADSEALIYSGEEITPSVIVTVDDSVVSDAYYTLSYSDNVDAGTATITVTMQDGYAGTATKTFKISQKTLTEDDFEVTGSAVYAYGSYVEAPISTALTLNTDYTISYSNNVNVGTASFTVTGIGNYTGTVDGTFEIESASLSDSNAVTIEVTGELSYTGEDVKPAVVVSLNGVSMTEGTDYELDYASATEEGNLVDAGNTGIVIVTFQGNYSGTATATYTIAKADQALTVNHDTQELPVSASKDLSTLNLVSGNQTELVYGLAEGDGFTLNGSVLTTPETEKAAATITIYAAEGDNYNASEPVAVTVTTVNKAEVSVTFADGTATYTGEALTYEAASVEVEETDGTWTYVYYDANGTKLDSAPTDAGTYTVTATYTSSDSTGTANAIFTIEPQPVDAAVALTDSSAVYTYTGNAIEPDVEITVGEAVLTEDTVYTYEISYADNVNASTEESTATVTVTFTGNYSGEASTTFTIEARTLTAEDFALESDSVVYNGSGQTPTVILADGLNLAEDTDYSVVYANNTDVGTATVTIEGSDENCTGSVELTFEITGSDVSESVTVTVADGSCVYTGEAIEPEVTVIWDKSVLTEGEDYTVTYSNNINASTEESTATVTVTLTGNYSGTVLTESFTIEKAEQTLVMRNNGTIIAEIGETLDLTTLIEDSSSYAGTLLFAPKSGGVNLIGTGNTVLNIISELEAGTELELTVYALDTTNYNVSETVTFTVTAVARTSITIDSDNADVVVYERTTETDEDGEVQTVDTLLSADAETGAYSAKQGMTISFTVAPESGYGLPNVTVNGETVKPDENGFYVVELTAELLAEDSNLVISVSVKRTSWDESSGDTADADIESIIASVAAGTQTEDADGSTYEDSLDYNDDGKNDLLDILNILYRTEEQDTDSTDETVEEAASEDATEDATETSDGASEDASDEDSDESSDEAAAGSDSEAADDSGADTGADSEAASGDAAE